MPLIFLLLKKCEMILSICDVFFQHVEIQNLVIRESSGADISFSGVAAARAVGAAARFPPPAPDPGAGTATHHGSSLRAPGHQASSCRRAQEGMGKAQNLRLKCSAYSPSGPRFLHPYIGAITSALWDLGQVSHPRVAARMKLVNAGSVPRWAPATQSARCLCLTHYQFYCRCLCRNWKNSDSNPNVRFPGQ